MNSNKKVLDVKNLHVSFKNAGNQAKIINDISFYIEKGETLGVVGESGCGKSITALSVMRLLNTPPASITGEIKFDGENLPELSKKEMRDIRGNKISMIFQEPMTSLNPVMTVGQQLMEVFTVHRGLSKEEARKRSIESLKMVNIAMPEQRIDEYPHQLSGGMRQRVMIAMALSCNPKLLIADEPTTALDVTIQAQILKLMKKLKDELGTAIMFITHDLGVVYEICSRAVILYCGQIVEEAKVSDLFKNPLHPYTEGLLNSLPVLGNSGKLNVIPGSVPIANQFPEGCIFNPRCEHAMEKCKSKIPPTIELKDGHKVKCWLRCEDMEVE
ncbi:MAG: ABC transporter ATP-binding protein [Desulfitobacteriaceae bacterium]|jgi:oligopeptide/dipeptide ABC transporter ATP-binding protein|nr:ABC transporter ATP-binding protein [Desulfitobacteriaceae bacterium]MDD4401893.1 ABC transporter ATP-binding protein [Desulfitobacteriaceae bacterium]